jgi:hypothetical protein
MHESWVEAAELGDIAGVAMIDISAAYDVVDIKVILQKSKIMNFTAKTIKWLSSYLTGGQQAVYIKPRLTGEICFPNGFLSWYAII